MDIMVIKIAHCLSLALLSAPNAVPAPANARGIVKHAPQKFSFSSPFLSRSSSSRFKDVFSVTIYLLLNIINPARVALA